MYKNSLYAFAVLIVIFAGIMIQAHSSTINKEVLKITDEEYNWSEAMSSCIDLKEGWVLPSVLELVGLYYFNNDIRWHKPTDYWSSTRMLNRGFGLNTRFGILSLDAMQDQDHFICIRSKVTP